MRTTLWAAAGALLLSACAPGTYVIRPLDEGWRNAPVVEREVVREVVIEVPITHPVLPDPVDRPRPRPEPPVTPPAPPVEPPETDAECRTREMPPKSPFSHQIKCPGSPVVLVRR